MGSFLRGCRRIARTASGTERVTQARSLGHFPHPRLITKRAATLNARADVRELFFAERLIDPLDPIGSPSDRPG